MPDLATVIRDNEEAALLSESGAVWQLAAASDHIIDGIIEATSMPRAAAAMLAGRGISKDDVADYCDPKLRTLLPDPDCLADMAKAAGRLADAIMAGEAVGILGDYDVDGTASTALMQSLLGGLGVAVHVHIPNRFTEGYGANTAALLKLKEAGCQLILLLDCGTNSHQAIADAKCDTIVVDHHVPEAELPNALAIVNPKRVDDDSGLEYLAAGGVVFMLAVAVVRELRNRGWFAGDNAGEADGKRAEPNLIALLDYVALATVADVVPLVKLNRAFVWQGLRVMQQRKRAGLAALVDSARLKRPLDTEAISYVLAPRLNAAGRFGNANLALSLLVSQSAGEATGLATSLDILNSQRQKIEQEITDNAMRQTEIDEKATVAAAVGEDWHLGVIGICAGRLRDALNRPALVISVATDADGKRIGRGSGRSVEGFRLGNAVLAAVDQGLLLKGGGHDMAAGFTLDMRQFDALRAFLTVRATSELQASGKGKDKSGRQPPLVKSVAAEVSIAECTPLLLDWLDKVGPYGSGFPAPLFLLSAARAVSVTPMGKQDKHLAVVLQDGGARTRAVAFHVAGRPLGKALLAMRDGRTADVLVRLNRDSYHGRNQAQLLINDVRFCR